MTSVLMFTQKYISGGMLSKGQQMGDDRDYLASSVTHAQLKKIKI